MGDAEKEEAKALAVRCSPRFLLGFALPHFGPPTAHSLALPPITPCAPFAQAEEAAIEMFKVKKLIKSLERARG